METLFNALHGIVLSLSAFLLTSLLLYEKRLSDSLSQKYSSALRKSVLRAGTKTSQVIGKWLRILCVITALLCVCTCINDLVYYNVDMTTDGGCTAPRNLGVALLSTLDFSIYLFLWLRQYLVYKSIRMEHGPIKIMISIFQWTTLGLIVGIFLSTVSLLSCCRRYVYIETNKTCDEITPKPVHLAVSYLWSVGSVILHSSLVLMFAFPLMKAVFAKKGEETESNKSSQKRMMALVRRCLILSLLCVVTDVVVMLTTLYALKSSPSQLRHLLYNINVLINCTLLVVSFKEWRSMLFPCVDVRTRKGSIAGIGTTTSQIPKENLQLPECRDLSATHH